MKISDLNIRSDPGKHFIIPAGLHGQTFEDETPVDLKKKKIKQVKKAFRFFSPSRLEESVLTNHRVRYEVLRFHMGQPGRWEINLKTFTMLWKFIQKVFAQTSTDIPPTKIDHKAETREGGARFIGKYDRICCIFLMGSNVLLNDLENGQQ